MKKILGHVLTLILEFAALALAIIWYIKNRDIEPLIVMISAVILIIGSIFFRSKDERKGTKKNVAKLGKKSVGNTIIQDNKGNININGNK
jgi:hypothetical protein